MFNFTFSIPTPQTFAFKARHIAYLWWTKHDGKENTQELLLAIILFVVESYFYFIELAMKAAVVTVRYTRTNLVVVSQLIRVLWAATTPVRFTLSVYAVDATASYWTALRVFLALTIKSVGRRLNNEFIGAVMVLASFY